MTPLIAENLKRYCEYFPQLVTSSNSSMELIKEAIFFIYRFEQKRMYKENPKHIENYFELTFEIIDDRGKKYIYEFRIGGYQKYKIHITSKST